MATATFTVEANADGKTLEVLQDLITKRCGVIKGTSDDAVIATAINITQSLRGLTKKSPTVGKRTMYTIEQCSVLYASWEKKGGKTHRVCRNLSGKIDWNVTHRCRNYAGQTYTPHERVYIYKIQLFNEDLPETLYWCFAHSEAVARAYIEKEILARVLKKESGLAKNALGFVMGKLSTRNPLTETNSKRAILVAKEAASVDVQRDHSIDGGGCTVTVRDMLRYATGAVKGGEDALDFAMKRAANKTAGLLHLAFVDKKLDEDVPTPFPEVKAK